MTDRVFIIGAGRVGRGLNRAFRASGTPPIGLHGRRPGPDATSSGALPATIGDANAIILAVRDPEIDPAIDELLRAHEARNGGRLAQGTAILHTSGSLEPEFLGELAAIGMYTGTFHPLIPFVNPERVPDLLRKAWIGIDGDAGARATSRRLAGRLGARTIEIPPGGKASYHAAAVMASNLPVVLAALASGLLKELGIPSQSAEQAVQTLMRGAVENLAQESPDDALTGPIVRGDADAVMRHLQALRNDQDARAVYKRLSIVALDMAARRGTDPEKLEEIQRLLLLR